jgi:hypothetical protein
LLSVTQLIDFLIAAIVQYMYVCKVCSFLVRHAAFRLKNISASVLVFMNRKKRQSKKCAMESKKTPHLFAPSIHPSLRSDPKKIQLDLILL